MNELSVAGHMFHSHPSQLFLEIKLLDIEQGRTAQIGEFMYHSGHNLLPVIYRQLFLHTSKVYPYSTGSS